VLTTAVRTISVVKPKFSKTRPTLTSHAVSRSQTPYRRPITRSPSSNSRNSHPSVTTAKPSAGNSQQALKDKGVIDSGCSRHITWNMSYLFDFEELNGGYVSFGGNPKGGKITRKGKIKNGKLDFDDVYFVKELKFNLFSVSQMIKGIKRELSVPRTPQQNGIAERKNRTISVVKPKFSKTRPTLTSHAVSRSQTPYRRPITRSPSSNSWNSPPSVTTAKPSAVSAAQHNKGTWV
nr:ribonuclease H-like domain-containing protein [Tanacetum cinerariifolium]